MGIIKMDFNRNPNIGLYGFATDKYCLIGDGDERRASQLKHALGVEVISTSLVGTELVGIFAAGNSSGVIVPSIISDYELKHLKTKLNVLTLESKHTALGNLMVVNDKGCVISPIISKFGKKIQDFLNVPVSVSTVAGTDLVGSMCLATNMGCVVHKESKKPEISTIEKTLGVKSGLATVNFSSLFVKSGCIANSNGLVLGDQTTGPETENIVEILGLL